MKHADATVDCDKTFKKNGLKGPLLWEFLRTEEEKMLVEISKRFRMLCCHTNFQSLTNSDQDGPAEDHEIGYLKKA